MTLPNRLEEAVLKLYEAFYNDTLHPEDACRCAVGNILDQKDYWKNFSDDHGSFKLNYVGNFHETIGRKFNGYSPAELLQIEAAFLQGCGYNLPLSHSSFKPSNPTNPDVLFNGLSKTIDLLCSLEGMTTLMNIQETFYAVRLQKVQHLVLT